MASETEPGSAVPSLAEWTRRLARGDDDAWRWFHEQYYLFLLRYAASRTSDPDAANEIAQDTYLRVARHVRPFAEEQEFRSWLACLVRCAAVDQARHRARRATLLERFAHWREALLGSDSARASEECSTSSLLEEALSQLADDDAVLLRRKYCDGWSLQELASDAQTTPKAIENRLARLRQRLRLLLCRLHR